MIHHACGAAELDDVAEELLARLAAGPTVAIGLTKQTIRTGQHATLEQAMTQELYNLELSCRTTDFKEGLAAFQRAPHAGLQRPMTGGNTHVVRHHQVRGRRPQGHDHAQPS